MTTFEQFTNLYQQTKTLRFELIPQGKTLEHIEQKGLITQDEERATSYKEMKKTIDGFHKYFIEMALSQVCLTHLEDFAKLYNAPNTEKKQEKYKKELEKIQTNLRKEIVKQFKSGEAKPVFLKLFKKELITELLKNWVKEKQNEENYYDEGFEKFTTYFSGFHENRKNMYTDKAQSTAIAYRLIHENLPKFIDNISIFQKIKTIPEIYDKCTILYQEIEEYLNISKIDEAFQLEYFNETLTQTDIAVYNLIIGGRTVEEGGKKIQGLNEFINLYNQKQERKNRVPKLKILYKQILSDRVDTSFLQEKFEDDEESTASQKVLDTIENYYKSNLIDYKPQDKEETENILEGIQQIVADLSSFDLEKIYIRNDSSINEVSKILFGDWSLIKAALSFQYANTTLENGRKPTIKQQEIHEKQKFYSIAEIESSLISFKQETEILKDLNENSQPIVNYFKEHCFAKQKEETDKIYDYVSNIKAKYSCIKGVLGQLYLQDKKLNQDKLTISNIKLFLDSILELMHFVKPLALPNDTILEKDEHFYGQFDIWFEQLQLLIPLYNKVRNFATQKRFSIEKFKLNFDNSHFLSGWASEYSSKGALIIKRNENFYLAIVNKKLKDKDISFLKKEPEGNLAHRVIYDFQKPDYKNIPRIFIRSKGDQFSPAVEKYNLPVQSIIDIYDNCYFKTEYRNRDPEKYKSSLIKLIDYFKEGLTKHESYKHYSFGWKESSEYEDISAFYNDVTNSCYQLLNEEINFNNLLELVAAGKIYLFQIYNKDFSPYSKGKPNLHTMYWKALFSPDNLKNVIYKLNGKAEMFYRRKSIDDNNQVVHRANEPIKNKNPLNPKTSSQFKYDIIKDKRYTVDKFQFHVPITLNFKATGGEYINSKVLEHLKNNPDINIIGIDRGERHLIYLTLINQNGEIKQQFSLNEIINSYKNKSDDEINVKTSYHSLLHNKEMERDKARKDWGTIENIKELKEGYISQVIHIIAEMMVEHNAIVVMEDLNFGFKRGRFKVEKQVYQKLEKRLIDKLNYLVFKDKLPNKVGGLYKALQLTNKFESFQKMGKQSGFLFYVPAWNTSKIDPTTGFVNLFDTRYHNIDKAKQFFESFDSIHYNSAQRYFEFKFDYSNFTDRAGNSQTRWTVCTFGNRIKTFRNKEKNNQWDNLNIDLTNEFKLFFEKYAIDFKAENLQSQVVNQDSKEFFTGLMYLLRLTLQMRNSMTNSDIDYLVSPVMNTSGVFFDSRNADNSQPKDADANGAYHIAMKGLWIIHQINKYEDDNWKKLKLAISNKEWLSFAQSNL